MANWNETLAERLDLPGELLPGVPRLTLTGSHSVLVENHRELLLCTEELVVVGCGRLRLRILGTELLLRSMDRDELQITGNICGVEVEGT